MATTTPPNVTLPLPQSTPIKLGSATMLPFTTNQKFRIQALTVMGAEIKSFLLGPMPAQAFLDEFFPIASLPGLSRIQKFTPGCFESVLSCKSEPLAYTPFNEAMRRFAPALKFVNSSAYVDSNPRTTIPFDIKPDVTCYDSTSTEEKTNSATAEIFIEFKWSTTDDPFYNPRTSQCKNCGQQHVTFVNDSNAAKDTLGQITSYAAVQLSAQFRTHVYSVFIMRNTARILRWDRSGTIVTEAFDYDQSPYLVDFFRRYSVAPAAMRGKDNTVSTPDRYEARPIRKALKLGANIPLAKLSVPGPNGTLRYFYVATPKATAYTPPGRATHAFSAYDPSSEKAVFLKDTWRINLPTFTPEGDVYAKLNAASVRNVPQCLASGDISTSPYHATKTCDYVQSSWVCKGCFCYPNGPWVPHQLHRLVLNILGNSLVDYNSSHEMVTAVRDSLHAHLDAYSIGILHRDISAGNIIIQNGQGWLIDWDMSKPVSSAIETPRRATRTGTWQFMSAALISQPMGQHGLRDDLESSIYVLLWVALMYSETSDPEQATLFVKTVLDQPPLRVVGPLSKRDFLIARTFLALVKFRHRPALDRLIDELACVFGTRYVQSPSAEERRDAQLIQELVSNHPQHSHLYYKTAAHIFDERTSQLDSHEAIIKIFDNALLDENWPENDRPSRQEPNVIESQAILKSGWHTSAFMVYID